MGLSALNSFRDFREPHCQPDIKLHYRMGSCISFAVGLNLSGSLATLEAKSPRFALFAKVLRPQQQRPPEGLRSKLEWEKSRKSSSTGACQLFYSLTHAALSGLQDEPCPCPATCPATFGGSNVWCLPTHAQRAVLGMPLRQCFFRTMWTALWKFSGRTCPRSSSSSLVNYGNNGNG